MLHLLSQRDLNYLSEKYADWIHFAGMGNAGCGIVNNKAGENSEAPKLIKAVVDNPEIAYHLADWCMENPHDNNCPGWRRSYECSCGRTKTFMDLARKLCLGV